MCSYVKWFGCLSIGKNDCVECMYRMKVQNLPTFDVLMDWFHHRCLPNVFFSKNKNLSENLISFCGKKSVSDNYPWDTCTALRMLAVHVLSLYWKNRSADIPRIRTSVLFHREIGIKPPTICKMTAERNIAQLRLWVYFYINRNCSIFLFNSWIKKN